MKKVNFDAAEEAEAADKVDLSPAISVLENNRDLLHLPGVIATWVGARAAAPYIMVAVGNQETDLASAIPDTIEGIDVYYLKSAPDS
jgi:hypothetical protein